MNTKLSTEEMALIFSQFDGMDREYIELIRNFHNVYLDGLAKKYTDDYVEKARAETKRNVKELKARYIGKALEVVNKLREAYSEKPPVREIFPDRTQLFDGMKENKDLPLVKEQLTAQDKLAYEMKRNNNLILWKVQLEGGTVEDFRTLYADHKYDEDFMTLFNVELKKRAANDLKFKQLKLEIERPTVTSVGKHLDSLEKSFNFFLKNDMYPERLHVTGLDNLKYRNVDKDLSAFPVLEGPTYRPIFDIVSA